MNMTSISTWQLWEPEREIARDEGFQPHLDSWNSKTDPWTLSLNAYLDQREAALGPLPDKDAFLHMDVEVPSAAYLLGQRDLDNYLIPIVRRLGPARFKSVMGAKRVGGGSRIIVGVAQPACEPDSSAGWHRFAYHVASVGNGKQWKRNLHDGIQKAYSQPLPPGQVEVCLAWRCSSRRNWMNLWKPTIDVLGPILGEHPVKGRQYNPDDGRITRLHLHQLVDDSLGDAIDGRIWWRLHVR